MDEPSDIIVMNALAGALLEENGVLSDNTAKQLISQAYAELEGINKEAFESELSELSNLTSGESLEPSSNFERTIEAVKSNLEEKDVRARIDHRAEVTFSQKQSALYSLFRSEDPSSVDLSFLSASFQSAIAEPLRLLSESQYEEAIDTLAPDRFSTENEDEILIRTVLEGWANFWSENDERAAELADQALHLCDNCWEAKLLWMAATHERAYDIRGGKLDLGIVLSWSSEVPDGGSFDVFVDTDDSDTFDDWRQVTNEPECVLLDHVGVRNRVEFRLAGKLSAFPSMPSYHISVATLDSWSANVDEVERLLKTGPISDGSTETLTLYT